MTFELYINYLYFILFMAQNLISAISWVSRGYALK